MRPNTSVAKFNSIYHLTLKSYMKKALYDPNWGYYSSGTVRFGEDFVTHAKDFAPLFCERAYYAWRGMINSGEITENEPFTIYEFGAGTGEMALTILQYAEGRMLVSQEPEWQKFYTALCYRIGEISPALVEKQKIILKKYIALGKASVHQSDACVIDEQIPKGVGIVLTNELIDALPIHELELTLDKQDNIIVSPVILAATIPESILVAMLKDKSPTQHKLTEQKNKIQILEKDWNISEDIIKKMRNDKRWIVTVQDMENLLKHDKNKYSHQIKLIKLLTSMDIIEPKEIEIINEIIQKSESILKPYLKKNAKKSIYIQTEAGKFFEKIKSFLKKGYVMTTDYGATGDLYVNDPRNQFHLRTFSNEFISDSKNLTGESPYEFPGRQDITIDVNFSDFTEIGLKHKVDPIYFGTQDDLGGFFLKGFYLLIQRIGISTKNSETCDTEILRNLSKPSSVIYQDIINELPSIRKGEELLRNFRNEPDFMITNIKNLLSWFQSTNYLERNWAYASHIETDFAIHFAEILDTMNYAIPQKLKLFKLNLLNSIQTTQQISILNIIIHRLTYTIFKGSTANLVTRIEINLRILAAEIKDFCQQKSIKLDPLPNIDSLREYNFQIMSSEEKQKTYLTRCLNAANNFDPNKNTNTNTNTNTMQSKQQKLKHLTNAFFKPENQTQEWRKYPDNKLPDRYSGHEVNFFTLSASQHQKAVDLTNHLKQNGFSAELKWTKDKPSIVVDISTSCSPLRQGK